MCIGTNEREKSVLKQEIALQGDEITELKEKLEYQKMQLATSGRKLKDYAKLVESRDDFEDTIMMQVRETERAIVNSTELGRRKEDVPPRKETMLQQVKSCEERFADVMLAVTELVHHCEHKFLAANRELARLQPAVVRDIRKVFHSNALLSSQLQDLGKR